MVPNACEDYSELVQYFWLNFIIICCAVASFCLEIHQVLETLKIMNKLKQVFEKKSKEDDSKSDGA